jgi:hypothetical protein
MQDTPKEAATGDKAARDLMLSELLQVCTPAPWHVVLSNNGTPFIQHTRGNDWTDLDDTSSTVCVMPVEILTMRNSFNNAKLIALAPTIAAELIKERAVNAKLLEACKLADAVWEGVNININAFERKLKAAIKQADEL